MPSIFEGDEDVLDVATAPLPSGAFDPDETLQTKPRSFIAYDEAHPRSETASVKPDTAACVARATIALNTQTLVESLLRVTKDVIVQHHEALQSELSQCLGCHAEVLHKSGDTANISSSAKRNEMACRTSRGGSSFSVKPVVAPSSSAEGVLDCSDTVRHSDSVRHKWSSADRSTRVTRVPGAFDDMPASTAARFSCCSWKKNSVWLQCLETVSGMIIFSNALFLGLRAHLMASGQTAAPQHGVATASCVFTVLFAVELVLRLSMGARSFFCSSDRFLNLFDFAVIALSILDELLTRVWHVGLTGISIGIFQIFRAMRIVRIVRALRRVPTLDHFITALAAMLGPFMCAMVLFQFVIYAFSVVFTEAAASHRYGACSGLCPDTSDDATLDLYFGTLQRSWGTLFQAVCGGVDWGDVANPMLKLGQAGRLYYTLFVLYVLLTNLALLNVVTALFCQHVVEHYLQANKLENKQKAILQAKSELLELFGELDDLNQCSESPPGVFTYPDLVEFLRDDRVKTKLLLLGIDPRDAWELFKLLDEDKTGLICISQFVTGCMSLRGEARRLDLHLMLHDFHSSLDKSAKFMKYAAEQLDQLDGIRYSSFSSQSSNSSIQ